jgi:uncharacterized protein (TIGR00730 family)
MTDLDNDLVTHTDIDVRPVSLDESRLSKPTPYPSKSRDFDETLVKQKTAIKKKMKNIGSIKNICVYCGSSPGADPVYVEAAKTFGARLAQYGVGLVYGGGGIGIMGAVARAVLSNGGHVTGIIPDFLLVKEGNFREVTEQHVVPDMHKRKMMMFERADAFVALPGGVGTLEEIVEVMTWAQLGRHGKPIVFANINGFWDPLLQLLDHMRAEGFIRPDMPITYKVANTVDDILSKVCDDCFPYPPPDPHKEELIKKRF